MQKLKKNYIFYVSVYQWEFYQENRPIAIMGRQYLI